MSTQQHVLNEKELLDLDAWWRASNYLAVGQLYLLDNPLLREPLKPEHIKRKIVGHWGTVPGQNFIYTHLNRVIKKYDLDMIYLSGPGHGGNAMVAQTYLEGTYSEIYPDVSRDIEGMRRLFKQFSFPGGIPSHVAPETPGSIHEGGELGYSLAHAFGAVFDNPDLMAKRKPAPWPPHGTAISSSIPRGMALFCRSCISTALRSAILRYFPGSPMRKSSASLRAAAGSPTL